MPTEITVTKSRHFFWRVLSGTAWRLLIVLALAFLYAAAVGMGATNHLPIAIKNVLVQVFGI